MIGHTLDEIRTQIEELATESGEYYLVCARHGDSPVPGAGLRFASRQTARAAARTTEQYRARLREYDSELRCYDIIVCQDTAIHRQSAGSESSPSRDSETDWTLSERVVGSSVRPASRIQFCHRVAAAVFEVLRTGTDDAVETAVLDAYDDLTETVTDPDSLCLGLLEEMAVVLDEQLSPDAQRAVVADAASRLPAPTRAEKPVVATFSRLETSGLLTSYTQSHRSETAGSQVLVSGYRLSPRNECLPVLPVVVEFSRNHPDQSPPSLQVLETEDGWRMTLGESKEHSRITSVPIRSEV